MTSSRSCTIKAWAKINLGLKVLYKRPDNYHELRTVFQTVSLADLVKEIHRALHDDRDDAYLVPDAPDAVAQEMLLFESAGSDDLEDVVDGDARTLRMSVRMPWRDSVHYRTFFDLTERDAIAALGEFGETTVTGVYAVLVRSIAAVVSSVANSYVFSFGGIGIMMILLLGSVRWGLLAMIPNVFPILVTLGVMGYAGLPLDSFTLMIGAIALGICDDDTIHSWHQIRLLHRRGVGLDEAVAEKIASVPGVELAVPTVAATAFTTDGSGDLLAVHGVDVTNDAAVRIYESRDESKLAIDDPLVFLSQPSSIALTREFAARKGLTLDSAVELVTPTGRRSFVVRALLEPHGIAKVYGGNLVVMDLQAAEAFFTEPGMINRIDVVARRDGDLDRTRADVATRLPPGLRIETPAQRKADLQRVTAALQTMLSALGVVGLIAAFLISFSRIATMYDGRSWQIGMLRTAGIPARVVWWELVKESLIIGAIGVAVGIPLGIGLGRLILPVIGTTTSLATKQIVPDAEFQVRGASIALAAALGMLAALLAASLPAWRLVQGKLPVAFSSSPVVVSDWVGSPK